MSTEKSPLILDLECYPNYFLAMFMRVNDEKTAYYEIHEDSALDIEKMQKILWENEIITFNGNRYDIPLLELALSGADNQKLRRASDRIINEELRGYQFRNEYDLTEMKLNHIDIIEILIGKASLKMYGGRAHCRKMQDLPYDPTLPLSKAQMVEVREYCINDTRTTKDIFVELKPQIDLRRTLSNQYKIDLRSKSDAQIAEAVIKSEIIKKGQGLGKSRRISQFVYEVPEFIKDYSDKLKPAIELLTTQPFDVKFNSIEMPKDLVTMKIKIGRTTYQMGMGGLHSNESGVYHIASNKMLLADWDVASYYPAIILNCELYPKHLGRVFLDVYKDIVDRRLEAKRAGDKVTAECLKIVVNGGFGKFGSAYSILYAPELMVQVTITGQLALLVLIDRLESNDIPVVSGNTDGIVITCPKESESEMIRIISEWESATGFVMERTDYSGIYSRDVNNYIATTLKGYVKVKGCFAVGGFKKNPTSEICSQAVVKYIMEGIDFEDTLRECKDIRRFVTVRQVNGGAVRNGEYLGKSIRWYYAKGYRGYLQYKVSGNKVPKSDGAKPLMELPDTFPTDIDYDWYLKECNEMLTGIGMRGPNGQMSLLLL